MPPTSPPLPPLSQHYFKTKEKILKENDINLSEYIKKGPSQGTSHPEAQGDE
jgi:hypothetical protein